MTAPSGILFSDPQVKPLSIAGQFQAGCYLQFYFTGGTTPAAVYQDGALTTPFSPAGQVTSDSAGRFPPIYLNPSTVYRVQLWSAGGAKLEDVDPYLPGASTANAALSLYAVDSGAANAYILTAATSGFSSYSNGVMFYWNALHANTGASTVNVNGLGIVNITNSDGTPLVAGQIAPGNINFIMYQNGAFILVSIVNQSGATTCYSLTTTSLGTGLTVDGNGIIDGNLTVLGSLIGPGVASASIKGTFKNLAVSTNGTNNNIVITADELALETAANLYYNARGVNVTVAGTAVGVANGLDAGSLATNTWYSLWIIYNGTTVAGLMSLSPTAPTLPSGYTYYARVGWIRTDNGSKYPLSMLQFGRRAQWKLQSSGNLTALPQLVSGAAGSTITPTWVSVPLASTVPQTATKALLTAQTLIATLMVAPNNAYGAYNSTSAPPPFVLSNTNNGITNSLIEMLIENPGTAPNFYYASSGPCYVWGLGWEDNF